MLENRNDNKNADESNVENDNDEDIKEIDN